MPKQLDAQVPYDRLADPIGQISMEILYGRLCKQQSHEDQAHVQQSLPVKPTDIGIDCVLHQHRAQWTQHREQQGQAYT